MKTYLSSADPGAPRGLRTPGRCERAASNPSAAVHVRLRPVDLAGPQGATAGLHEGLAARAAQQSRLRAAAHDELWRVATAVAGCAPEQVRVEARPGAAPQVRAPRPLAASLSHTPGWVAVAVARRPRRVGVDVQAPLRPAIAQQPLAASVLSDLELQEWDRLAAQDRAWALLSWWTRKEAVLKALGVGLAEDPRLVCTSLAGQVRALPCAAGDPRAWTVVSWRMTHAQHPAAAAVAVDWPQADVDVSQRNDDALSRAAAPGAKELS